MSHWLTQRKAKLSGSTGKSSSSYVYGDLHAVSRRGQKRAIDALVLELNRLTSSPVVLEFKVGSSERAAGALARRFL